MSVGRVCLRIDSLYTFWFANPPNAMLVVAQVESVDLKTRTLHVSGLDLVDGYPPPSPSLPPPPPLDHASLLTFAARPFHFLSRSSCLHAVPSSPVSTQCLNTRGHPWTPEGTPVIDIKPYIASYDSLPDASSPTWTQRGHASSPLLFVIGSRIFSQGAIHCRTFRCSNGSCCT